MKRRKSTKHGNSGDPELALRIRAYRELHGLSFRALAAELGLSPMAVCRAEKGSPLGIRVRAILRKCMETPRAAA